MNLKQPQVFAIEASYKNDFNILIVHNKILSKFEHDRSRLEVLRKEMDKLQSLITLHANTTKAFLYRNSIRDLQREIDTIQNNILLETYNQETQELIQRYKELRTKGSECNAERQEIIWKYLAIANKYIRADIIQETTNTGNKMVCDDCKIPLIVDTLAKCPQCGVTRRIVHNHSVKDTGNESVGTDIGVKEFCDLLDSLQCKQKVNYNPQIFDDIDNYFVSKGGMSGAQIRAMPLKGRRRGPYTISDLLECLKCKGYSSKEYKSVQYFAMLHWGWIPLNFQEHMQDLIILYERYLSIYNKYKGERKSKLSRTFVALELFKYKRIDILQDDLKMVGDETLGSYKETWVPIAVEMGLLKLGQT